MKYSLFNKKITPKCIYCSNGVTTADGQKVLCSKRGVMLPDSHCKKFNYDVLKRVPESQPAIPCFTAEDFSID